MSSSFAALYSGIDNVLPYGLDAAWFFQSDHLNDIETKLSLDDGLVGYSFSRTVQMDARLRAEFEKFSGKLQEAMGLHDIINIKWLKKNVDDPLLGLKGKIDTIKQCSLVITDTYHCAINSLREGIPTICIGAGDARSKTSTIGEKKKEWLYQYLNIPELYVYSSEIIGGKSRQCIRRVQDLLKREGEYFQGFQSRLQNGKELIIGQLMTRLR